MIHDDRQSDAIFARFANTFKNALEGNLTEFNPKKDFKKYIPGGYKMLLCDNQRLTCLKSKKDRQQKSKAENISDTSKS